MSETFEAVRKYLRGKGMIFTEHEDRIMVPMACEHGKWQAMIVEWTGCLVCSSLFPVNAPSDRRAAVAELLARLNWRLLIGNWEMDWSDGEIRYKSSLPLRNLVLTPSLVGEICGCNFDTFVGQWEMVMAVVAGKRTPAAAIEIPRRRRKRQKKAFDEVMRKAGFEPHEL